jgi:hypothetical protein
MNTEKFNKGITLTKEELNLVGIILEMGINNRMIDGTSPERFKMLREIETRLKNAKK